MDNSIVYHNANFLWNFSDRHLDVDSQGKLSVIQDWDLCSRIRKFFRNWKGAVTQKIHNAVLQTLDSIEKTQIKEVWDEYSPREYWGYKFKDSVSWVPENRSLRELADHIDRVAKFKLIPGIKSKTDTLRILSDRYDAQDEMKKHLLKLRRKAEGEATPFKPGLKIRFGLGGRTKKDPNYDW
jgi:hypothetical protein